MVMAAVRSWAEKDGNAAKAWVLQLAPGQERERALQSVVSALSEKDPQAALGLLQSLPASSSGRNLYWPIFSNWANSDPDHGWRARRAAAAGPGARSGGAGGRGDLGESKCGSGFRVGERTAGGPGA